VGDTGAKPGSQVAWWVGRRTALGPCRRPGPSGRLLRRPCRQQRTRGHQLDGWHARPDLVLDLARRAEMDGQYGRSATYRRASQGA